MIINPKAQAWDLIGSMFWKHGRKNARPSRADIERLLVGVGPGGQCVIIGASTKELIEAAIRRNASVVVLDFSERMCRELAETLANSDMPCHIVRCDITGLLLNGL